MRGAFSSSAVNLEATLRRARSICCMVCSEAFIRQCFFD
ncbi:hypothetical protein EVA_06468 [gut metagenome]|uniref:Uncharacterized protein n=1 Tax=gut metagenome TaxID=749906 RepID=J9GXG8_9ZZZZ